MTGVIGFVCTNFNNSAVTRRAVESLCRQGGDGIRVVIVDNRSNEDDVAALRRVATDFANVDLVLNRENVGYFPGLNIGIRHLRARFPEAAMLVVGNNDLEFPSGFLDAIRDARALFETWAVVAPDLVTPEGVHQNPHVRFPIGWTRRFVWDWYYAHRSVAALVRLAARVTRKLTARAENVAGNDHWRTPGPIEQGYGACYLLGPAFFRQFTALYAPTFLMQEEYFLFEQLRTIEQLTYYEPRIVVRHQGHATMGLLPSRRHWELSRAAHRKYKQFRRLPSLERRRLVAAVAAT